MKETLKAHGSKADEGSVSMQFCKPLGANATVFQTDMFAMFSAVSEPKVNLFISVHLGCSFHFQHLS